jgi:hypothetical protein
VNSAFGDEQRRILKVEILINSDQFNQQSNPMTEYKLALNLM